MFFIDSIYRLYRVAFVLLFLVPNLYGAGYTFIKKKGIPEQLIPQDCPAGKVPEATELTPTQAHLYAWNKGGCLKLGGFRQKIKPDIDVVKQIVKNEQLYAKTHCMFYHGQNGCFRLLQDFFNELYSLLRIEDELLNFKFFRVWSDATSIGDVEKFLYDERKNIASCNFSDCSTRLQRKLLSVNLSLFGNEGNLSSCTYYYFQNNNSMTNFNLDWIIESIKKALGFDLTGAERTLLKNLVDKVSSDGSLFQICIPREQVNKCVYLCVPGGMPYHKKLIKSSYDAKKKRHVGISDICDAYIKPGFLSFFDLDQLQARILISQDIMLNPESGVKFFRFTHTNNQDTYQEDLTQFVYHIAMRYFVETSFSGKKDMPFNRLAAMIFNK